MSRGSAVEKPVGPQGLPPRGPPRQLSPPSVFASKNEASGAPRWRGANGGTLLLAPCSLRLAPCSLLLTAYCLLLVGTGTVAADEAVPPTPAVSPAGTEQPALMLQRGGLRTLAVEKISRVAVGDPAVVDVTVVSPTELLLQAKTPGSTNLIVWDAGGQRVLPIEVVEGSPESLEAQLRSVIARLALPAVSVTREGARLFVVGQVDRKGQLEMLKELLAGFPDVTNLVGVAGGEEGAEGAPPRPTDLVKLVVQIIEISKTDLEKLGVKWSEGASLTEPEVTDQTLDKALTRFGTSLTRASFKATLNALVRKNRARVLAEPKLVTATGKEATSFIGVEVPYVTATSIGTTTSTVSSSIQYRETGVLLKMTPYLNTIEGRRVITTKVQAELSDLDTSVAISVPVGTQTVSVPGFKVRKMETQVTTDPGESIVVAGLLESKDTRNIDQVPALGSMPILGRLFRSPELETIEKDIVIVVTPDIVSELMKPRADSPQAPPAQAEHVEGADRGMAVDDALEGAEVRVRPTVSDPSLRYALEIQDRLSQGIRYPARERSQGRSGKVVLQLHVLKDGRLDRATLLRPSGIEAFDTEALKAAEALAPYPPFPPDVAKADLWLELPVQFTP